MSTTTRRSTLDASLLCGVLLCAMVGVALDGCGGASATKTVTGSVSYQHKPVTSGLVNFLPEHGRPLGGPISPDGTYSVKLPAGKYKVRVDAPGELPAGYKEGDPTPPRIVPEKYANYSSSGLAATIEEQGSSQHVDFNLQ